MTLLRSLAIAFSTYSKIPMPQFLWRDADMRWSMGFFPLVGAVIGAAYIGWMALAGWLGFGAFLTGAIAAVLPLLITGGIHMDGFADTIDALSSHQSTERKLEILKDPHAGAFAVIYVAVYLIAQAGILSEIADLSIALIVALGFVLSRALSALAVLHFKRARPGGMLSAFAQSAERQRLTVALALWIALCAAAMLRIAFLPGLLAVIGAGAAFGYYRFMSYRRFGGATGDLAGYFLQICELCIACAAMLAGKIGG